VRKRVDGQNRRGVYWSGKVEDEQRNDEEPEHRFPDYPGANTQVMLHIEFIPIRRVLEARIIIRGWEVSENRLKE
jgi:hypothetical protein